MSGGARGQAVTLRHAEYLHHNGDGMIDVTSLRGAPATDTLILSGVAGRSDGLRPHFTYHGFRFVEVTKYPGEPTKDSLECYHFHSDVERIGHADFSMFLLNKLFKNILYTQTANLMSIPTDCPQRDERHGWTADAHLSSDEAIHNFFMPSFYENWMTLMDDDQ